MSFLVGLLVGLAAGGAAGLRYAPREIQRELTRAWKLLPPEIQEVGERTQADFLERFQRAQQVYLESRERTRERLERELESARETHR